MGLLLAVKHRTTSTDNMFEPLRKTLNLLKQFGVEIPDEVTNHFTLDCQTFE
jgi:dynein heavy chain